MNRETRIIKTAIGSRQAFTSLHHMLGEDDMSRVGWALWCEVADWYEQGDSSNVDIDTLKDIIKVKYKNQFKQFYVILDREDVDYPDNVVNEFLLMKEDNLKQQLAEACLSSGNREEIRELIEELITVQEIDDDTQDDTLISVGINDVIDVLQPENIITTSPSSLNDRLGGGFVPGNQFVIYANTEVGKSLMAISMTCDWLRQGRRVLYLGNEDAEKMMLLRVFSNLASMNKEDILRSPKVAEQLAFDNGYSNLIFYPAHPGSISELRRYVEKHRPEIVIVDQMANMGMGGLGKTEKNEQLASSLRAMAKKYNLVTGIIHQADNEAHGKLVLEKNNMHYSNVGVQGQMDVMIGIGMDSAFENQKKRMLCLTKNKLSGDHSFFPVNIDEQLSKVW